MTHKPNCQREIMRHADDTAAYLSEPCTCGATEMSETTEKIEAALKSARQTFGGQVEMIVPLSVLDLERIARLLADDDERIARRGHFDRLMTECYRPSGDVANAAWVAWERAWTEDAPLPELDRCEAVYRAALTQEPHR